MNKSRAQLKAQAKEALRGNWGNAILMVILPTLIIFGITLVFVLIALSLFGLNLGMLSQTDSFYGYEYGFSVATGFGVFLLSIGYLVLMMVITVMQTGVQFGILDLFRNPRGEISPFEKVFQGFKNGRFSRIIIVNIVMYIFVYLWTLLLVIPGIIKTFSYSQSLYILKDNSESGKDTTLSAIDYITLSRRLMDGHKMRFFILQLSFIGWAILATFTLGIGYLFLLPYMMMANAAFYDDLVETQKAQMNGHEQVSSTVVE